MEKRSRRSYTEEFKKQMVDLYNSGKSRTEIAREYELTEAAMLRREVHCSFKNRRTS